MERRYDVFISFRGEDTRKVFTDHLYHTLVDSGINAFMDNKSLHPGEEISIELINAIRESRISVVVFSQRYADSRWCLDELVEIMECRRTAGQIVMPVFMDVYPTHVRNQFGSFADAFAQHHNNFQPDRVAKWKSSLKEASTLSGWGPDSPYYNQQGLLVREIIRKISLVLSDKWHMDVADFPVGLDSRVLNLRTTVELSDDHNNVQFIGILGMGGIGKTTAAKMLYNQLLHQFDGASFLKNVRARSQQPSGLAALQEKLLDDICRSAGTIPNLSADTERGSNMIRSRLGNKKVLIFLDDVSNEKQIRVLAGGHERDWFGPGSRVVLTTRNKHLLTFFRVDKIYKATTLDDAESLKLFSSHTFGEHNLPGQVLLQKSINVVSYCKGVPLALVVLGRALKGQSEVAWDGILEKLNAIPHNDLQEKLRISYDELADDTLKELFLDIACFFVGCDKDYAVAILEASGLYAETGMDTLYNRGLVEVDEKNQLKMHDLICKMGREIVRKESPDNPGKRSRLWLYPDVKSTLKSLLGTYNVKGIALDSLDVLNVDAEAFRDMKRLRLLNLNNLDVEGMYGLISKGLRWLCWHNFSRITFPDDLQMEKMVAIDMQYSKLQMFYNIHRKNKELRNLRFLNLSHSKSLTMTPNFLNLPNLEEIIFEDCVGLTYIHHSIGELDKLVLANFKGCKKLMRIPTSINRLESLKIFNTSGCSNLGSKISNSTSFSSPSQFILSWLLTSRFFRSSYLQVLSLGGLRCLRVLKLMDCGLSNNAILLNGVFTLLSLEELDLRKNNFTSLPHNIIDLVKLKVLLLDDCKYLESLPNMPASLFTLSATNCTSLKRVSVTRFEPGTQLLLSNCHQLTEIFGLDCQEPGGNIHLEQCNNLTYEFKYFLLKNWCGRGHVNVFLPGSEVPEWFDCSDEGYAVDCKIPLLDQDTSIDGQKENEVSRPKGFTVCVVFAPNEVNTGTQPFPVVKIEALNLVQYHSLASSKRIAVIHDHDHMWVFHLPASLVEQPFQLVRNIKLSVEFGVGWTVKRVGAYFYFGSYTIPSMI